MKKKKQVQAQMEILNSELPNIECQKQLLKKKFDNFYDIMIENVPHPTAQCKLLQILF